MIIVILGIVFSITTLNRGNVPSSPMPGPLGGPYLPMPSPYLPMPGPYLPMPGPIAGPLDYQYDNEVPLTPEEDLRSFDSGYGQDQFPLTPEEDLRSFDSGYGQGLPSYDDQFPLTPEEDLRSFDSFQ